MLKIFKKTKLLSILLACTLSCSLYSYSSFAMPRTNEELKHIFDTLTQTPVEYGSIPALYNPELITVSDANNSLDKTDQVFLVAYPNGEIRVYPQRIMVWHEVVNELIDGQSYAVTYSPISGCFASYESTLNGTNLMFDVDGRLYNNNSVLRDRNTGSLWLQITGVAFEGPLKGRGLKLLPIIWTNWEKARTAFPNAKVMTKPLNTQRSYGRDPYGSYEPGVVSYYQNETIHFQVSKYDKKFKPKNEIIGIEYKNLFLSIDIDYVKKEGFVNFFVGPYPLLAVHDKYLDIIRVFTRNVWDQATLFNVVNGQLVDIDTNTVWNMDGIAVDGKLKGASLEQLFGIYSFWFVWSAINNDTITVPGESMVPKSALIRGNIGSIK